MFISVTEGDGQVIKYVFLTPTGLVKQASSSTEVSLLLYIGTLL